LASLDAYADGQGMRLILPAGNYLHVRALLINADDLGYDADTFATTTALMHAGALKSATILVGYPESSAAMAFAKTHARDFSFGLHFNIAEGTPLAPQPVPSLVGPDGQFRSPIPQRLRALTGLLRADDIAREAEAQLTLLADHGVTPSHIDSHGHFHKFPRVLAALQPVLRRFGIRRLRLPQSLYDNERVFNRLLDAHCLRGVPADASTTDGFFNTRSHADGWFERFLGRLPDGTTELGVHPGSIEDWRVAEAQPLAAAAASGELAARGIRLISYHDLPA
jgi:chitin disaccharide deacetylase